MDLKDSISFIEKFIITALQNELILQGHSATGSLYNSFEGSVITVPNGVMLEILANDYAINVNDGRKAGGKKIPINVLVDWIEQRGIANGDKEVVNMAFAIQQKIWQEGSPTSGSLKYSQSGNRKGFIDIVIANELSEIFKQLEDSAFKGYDSEVEKIVKDFNQKNK